MTLIDALIRPRTSATPVLSSVVGLLDAFTSPKKTWSPDTTVIGSILSADPPILFFTPQPKPFGAASYFAGRYPDRRITFLSPLMWSHEVIGEALSLAYQHRRFARAHPKARLVVLANTEKEEARLRGLGVDVQLAPRMMFVDDRWYRPLPGVPKLYDAVYNAQLAPFKRHALARLVPSCAYISYVPNPLPESVRLGRIHRFIAGLPAGHRVLNEVRGSHFERFGHLEVNERLNTAHVGLCLSRVEGVMFAAVEYLLAGLPVVTTPSQGGRDRVFHPETTVVVRDDPREVRDAVAALKAKAIPPDRVRSLTLAVLERERARFNSFVEELTGGVRHGDDPRWSFDFTNKLGYMRPLSDVESRLTASPGPAPHRH